MVYTKRYYNQESYLVGMGWKINVYKILVGKCESKRQDYLGVEWGTKL